jgi:hypothetical protein
MRSTAPAGREVVFVVGSGRSGTSTVTGVLQRVGLHVPAPEVPADSTNPRGFAEPQWVVRLNQQLLDGACVRMVDARPSAWDDCAAAADNARVRRRVDKWLARELVAHPRLAVKDPRLSWFIGTWTGAAQRNNADLGFVTMLRPPTEVLGSMSLHYHTRSGPVHGVAQWLNMLLGTERRTRGHRRAWLAYDRLLADPVEALGHIALSMEWPSLHNPSASQQRAVRDFVEPALRRSTTSWDGIEVPDQLRELAEDTWWALSQMANGEPTSPPLLDECWERYVEIYSVAEALTVSTAHAWRQRALQRRSMAGLSRRARDRAPRFGGRGSQEHPAR